MVRLFIVLATDASFQNLLWLSKIRNDGGKNDFISLSWLAYLQSYSLNFQGTKLQLSHLATYIW